MKKVLVSLILVSILVVPAMASAGWLEEIGRVFGIGVGGGVKPPGGTTAPAVDVIVVLDNLVDWLFAILLIIAAIAIIVAAYFFVTAAGDPDKTKKARDFVLYALVGVLVGISAKGLVALVRKIAG